MQETNKIWATGRPLSDYFLDQLAVIQYAAPGMPLPTISDEMGLPNPLRSIQAETARLKARAPAVEALRQRLCVGTIVLVGRRDPHDDKVPAEILPAAYWESATIVPERDWASDGRTEFYQLRLPTVALQLAKQSSRRPERQRASASGAAGPPDSSARPSRAKRPRGPGGAKRSSQTGNPSKSGGRPNKEKTYKRTAKTLFREDRAFRELPNRTKQAQELRARIEGEQARFADDMAGCKLATVMRWIGEVSPKQPKRQRAKPQAGPPA